MTDDTSETEMLEQLRNDGHTVRESKENNLVVIEEVDGHVSSPGLPGDWTITAAFEDGEIHIVK